MDEAPEYLSRKQTAELLDIELRTLDYLVQRGELAAHHRTARGRQSRPWFLRSTVEALRKQRQGEA
jgi:hypothetical protein